MATGHEWAHAPRSRGRPSRPALAEWTGRRRSSSVRRRAANRWCRAGRLPGALRTLVDPDLAQHDEVWRPAASVFCLSENVRRVGTRRVRYAGGEIASRMEPEVDCGRTASKSISWSPVTDASRVSRSRWCDRTGQGPRCSAAARTAARSGLRCRTRALHHAGAAPFRRPAVHDADLCAVAAVCSSVGRSRLAAGCRRLPNRADRAHSVFPGGDGCHRGGRRRDGRADHGSGDGRDYGDEAGPRRGAA